MSRFSSVGMGGATSDCSSPRSSRRPALTIAWPVADLSCCLPDLRGRTPVGYGNNPAIGVYNLGETFGVENVTLNGSQVPVHTHAINATTTAGTVRDPANSIYGVPASSGQAYAPAGGSGMTLLYAQQMQNAGGSQPHPNLQPFNVLNFSICLYGIFPSRG